jgi:3' exoribonuclease, RNase T-like
MIDMETLATSPTAKVLSIGAVLFHSTQPANFPADFDKEIYLTLNLQEQTLRYEDPLTVRWWEQQSVEARKALSDSKDCQYTISSQLSSLNLWFKDIESYNHTPIVWGNGAAFDNAIMISLYQDFSKTLPWSYKADMCYRTLRALKGDCVDWDSLEGGTYHNALDDAKYQARALVQMLSPEELNAVGDRAFLKTLRS